MTESKPSFSMGRKWGMALKTGLIVLLLLSIVVMANYISRDYHARVSLSTRNQIALSSRTVHFVKSLTNHVHVTLYYDQKDEYYGTMTDLIKEYGRLNPGISWETVDYLRNPGAAQGAKEAYKLNSVTDTNLIIFDCSGRIRAVPGNGLVHCTLELVRDEEGFKKRRKPLEFLGESAFTSALIEVTSPKKPLVCFLQGPNLTHSITSADELSGYYKFAAVAQESGADVMPIYLAGTNAVPPECNLLVVPGPRRTGLSTNELGQIDRYLTGGGRLMALFNAGTMTNDTGLEEVLTKWGVDVGHIMVRDPQHSPSGSADDLAIGGFSMHPVVNPVLDENLYMVKPRTISHIGLRTPPADAPRVEEIAFTEPLGNMARTDGRYSVMVAVEKGTVPGGVSERGTTRILVAGDSYFLANHQLDQYGNRDFAWSAINWLLARANLDEGIGPRQMIEWRLLMTRAQLDSVEWLLLGGLPGGALLVGALVWLKRRR